MCTVCGCAGEGATIEGGKTHGHAHRHGHDHEHEHEHDHHHHGEGGLHYGTGAAGTHLPGLSQARIVAIETNILAKNDGYAQRNRARLAADAMLALNLVSSPGSGKTTLLVETIKRMAGRLPVGVIEGDQQTANDAERIRATGAPAIQINTGKGCHLDAHMVGHALDHLKLPRAGVLFIENVGNLVCPAAFDLGEYAKVAVLSTTEGEDKPLKYPDMFAASRLMILNKIDLLPHLDFDIEACEANARRINPDIEILRVSAHTGEGLEDWLGWIERHRGRAMVAGAVAASLAGKGAAHG